MDDAKNLLQLGIFLFFCLDSGLLGLIFQRGTQAGNTGMINAAPPLLHHLAHEKALGPTYEKAATRHKRR
jgi:dihydrodipicolinate synthase/N-acetylneuraminate lyase